MILGFRRNDHLLNRPSRCRTRGHCHFNVCRRCRSGICPLQSQWQVLLFLLCCYSCGRCVLGSGFGSCWSQTGQKTKRSLPNNRKLSWCCLLCAHLFLVQRRSYHPHSPIGRTKGRKQMNCPPPLAQSSLPAEDLCDDDKV